MLRLLFIFLLSCFSGSVAQEKSMKKGLVIPHWPRFFCGDFEAFDTVSWWYNYFTNEDPTTIEPKKKWWCTCGGRRPVDRTKCLPQDPEVKYVPMVAGVPGYGRRGNESFPHAAPGHVFLLGYNEPNMKDQSNLPPRTAAEDWIKLQADYPADEYKLVSPATGHVDTEWFDQFWEACQELGCRIDYLATHLYKGTPKNRIEKLKAYSERYGNLQVWLTEFAVAKEHSEDRVVEFISEFLPMLEHSPFIYRYSWFVSRYYENHEEVGWFWIDSVNSLLSQEDSTLTKVGEAYNHPWHEDQYKPDNL